jgi:hypothetical protein
MRSIAFFMAVFLLVSIEGCKNNSDLLLSEDEMAGVMADLNIMGQILNKYPLNYRDSITDVLTESLLKIHNITQEQLDTNLYLYQVDPEKYSRVSRLMSERLEELKD